MNDPWTDLVSEGNFELINKLQRVENKEPGYGTIVVTKEGFSSNDRTHNKVLKWLQEKNVNILNPENEIANLKFSLGIKDEE